MKIVKFLLALLALTVGTPVLAQINPVGQTWQLEDCGGGKGNTAGCSAPPVVGLIFEENWDLQADWVPTGRCLFDGFSADCNNLPNGWDWLYTDDSNPTNPPCAIEAAAARGGSGKGFHEWDESRGDDGSWKAECQLAKRLPQAYPEVWVSFFMSVNPDALWEGGSELSKIFRMGMYNPQVMDGTAGTSIFNTNNTSTQNNGLGKTTGGMFFLDLDHVVGGDTALKFIVRCNPSYRCGTYNEAFDYHVDSGAGTSWAATFGDGQFHRIEIRMVMNTVVGVADGIVEVYYDGVFLGGKNDVPFRMAGADAWIEGINFFAIAGNSENVWAGDIPGPTSPEQSFYYIDDIKVGTTRESVQ